jgi:hypothetical protein
MRAVGTFSSRLPVIVAVLLACSLGSARAAVVFNGTSTDAVVDTVLGSAFRTYNFQITEGGHYQAIITDLSTINAFYDAFDRLQMQIANVAFTILTPPVGTPGNVATVDFTAPAAGSFVATVKSLSGAGGTLGSGYQVKVTLIPEPAIWVMLAAGFGLLGFVRIRRAAGGIV